MPFKIVQTIEKGKSVLTAVPHDWESDGILFWPKKHEKLRRIENSTPDTTWQRLNCIVKRSNLLTFEMAESEVDAMSNFSDTGTDNENTRNNKQKSKVNVEKQYDFNLMANECLAIADNDQQIIQDNLIKSQGIKPQHSPIVRKQDTAFANRNNVTLPINQKHTEFENLNMTFANNNNVTIPIENMNQEFQEIMAENVIPIIITPSSSSVQNTSNMPNIIPTTIPPSSSGLNTDLGNVINMTTDLSIILEKLDTMAEEIKGLTANQQTITQNQQSIFSNQGNMMTVMLEMQTQFEEYIKRNLTTQHDKTPDLNLKPVSNLKELQELEKKLADPVFIVQFRKAVANEFVCGKGKNRGVNNAYALIDVLFERSFLCDCSWTGASRVQDKETKICFKGFYNTCDFFFSIVHESDSEFRKPDFANFMKTVLKNAVQRSQSKRQRNSAVRNRQKGVNGNTKKSTSKKLSIKPRLESSEKQLVHENNPEQEDNSPDKSPKSPYNGSSDDSLPMQRQKVKVAAKTTRSVPKKLPNQSRVGPSKERSVHGKIPRQGYSPSELPNNDSSDDSTKNQCRAGPSKERSVPGKIPRHGYSLYELPNNDSSDDSTKNQCKAGPSKERSVPGKIPRHGYSPSGLPNNDSTSDDSTKNLCRAGPSKERSVYGKIPQQGYSPSELPNDSSDDSTKNQYRASKIRVTHPVALISKKAAKKIQSSAI